MFTTVIIYWCSMVYII